MTRVPDIAIQECVAEVRAACRRPIEEEALDALVGWLRPNFERILGHVDGAKRWAAFGENVRDHARYIGAFADFFSAHVGTETIGLEEIKRGYLVVRADCTVRGETRPMAYELCHPPPPPPGGLDVKPVFDFKPAEDFLRAMAPALQPA